MDVVRPAVRRVLLEAAEDPDRFWDSEARRLPWFRLWEPDAIEVRLTDVPRALP